MSAYSILIVDDEPDNFDVIQSLLPAETYNLHYAMNGEQALNSLEKYAPDIILLDVMMPGISGIEVCKQIKAMSEWKSIPIVMVTALSSKEDLAMCLAAGADDFVNKPVNGLELRARVNSMLRIKKQHDRIQSLSKLQRYNIHSLTNNIHEIRLDLAGGFSNEFDRPLEDLSDNNEHLKTNLNELSPTAILHILEQNVRSTTQLRSLMQKLWFYLQLVLEKSESTSASTSNLKSMVDRYSLDKFAGIVKASNITCKIENATLAVDPAHFQWICNESMEYIANNLKPNSRITIYGKSIGESFNLSFTGCPEDGVRSSITEIRQIAKENSTEDRHDSLEIGLKIVKKIVEKYEGLFLISDADLDENTIYITLPLLASSPESSKMPASDLSRLS